MATDEEAEEEARRPMLEAHELVPSGRPSDRLPLTFEQRRKRRLRATTSGGVEIGLFLPHTTLLLDGSLLRTTDGQIVVVEAAPEDVSTIASNDPVLLARLAYHLGDRHVRTQLGPGFVRYRHDRSTDELMRGLGAEVVVEAVPFEPERGAFGSDHDDGPGASP